MFVKLYEKTKSSLNIDLCIYFVKKIFFMEYF